MSLIFEKEKEVKRKEFQTALCKRLRGGAPPPKLSFKEKSRIVAEMFGPRNIQKISQDTFTEKLRKKAKKKFGAVTETGRKLIESEVGYIMRIAGIKSLKKPSQVKLSQAKLSRVKEEKKDISVFQGKPYLKRDEIRRWLKRDEAWRITKLPANKRPQLEKQLFLKEYGTFIDQREARKVYDNLRNYPTTRAKTKYGMKSRGETVRTSKLLKKFLGK